MLTHLGRPKGSLNIATVELKEFWHRFFSSAEYRESAKRRILSGMAPHLEGYLFSKIYGKPTEHVNLDVSVVNPLSTLTTEELTLRAEEIAKQLRDAAEAERELAPLVEVLTPKSLIPACPDDTVNVTPLRKDEESADIQASTETRENCGDLSVDANSADFEACTTDQVKHESSCINTGDFRADAKTDCKNTGDVCVDGDRDGETGGLLSMLRKLGVKSHA